MRPILYTLTSSLHGEMAPDPRQEPFIRDIEAALGCPFDCRGESSFAGSHSSFAGSHSSFAGLTGESPAPALIYIRTGGTEGLFLERVAPLLTGAEAKAAPQPVRLLASGQSNSLAASMEILSWLRQRGIPGEILHGSPAAIAARIRSFSAPQQNSLPGANSPIFAPRSGKNSVPGAEEAGFAPGDNLTETVGSEILRQAQDDSKRILEGRRFGVIGRPSDWLISSGVDYAAARERLGAELIDIPIDELVAETRQFRQENPSISGQPPVFWRGCPEKPSSPGTTLPRKTNTTPFKPLNAPRYGRKIDAADWDGALAIYEALKALVARYRLDGLTLRCFDLLTALHNTGCLALARLNAEGITATCDGDIPAMLSMAVARARTGRSSFQVNLSRIEGDRLLFAHCTVPLDIVEDYCYDTHFESGIGVAIHGILPEGPVTLFKLSPDCRRMYRREAKLVANPYGDNLCRTQVVVEAPGAAAYFLQEPIGNHHIIVPGKL